MSLREIADALLEVLNGTERGALATVVRVSGSTPHRPGARLLLRGDGSAVGTIGGGAIEREVLDALRRARSSGESEVLVRQLGYDLGMCCGGRMEVFVEPIEPIPRLIVFGAGHVARALAPMARALGFDVTIVDEREELLTEERFSGCALALDDPSAWLRRAAIDARHFLLIVTHDHGLDEQVLELALERPARYIGLVGSRRKTVMLLERIGDRRGGLDLDRVYAPVGLDLGAVGPEEVAVSIAAELVALRRGGSAPHLRLAPEREAARSDEPESV